MGKITYREIAKLAGVSLASVSFAIKNKPGVSDETRQKVLKIANQHGYFDSTLPIQAIIKRPPRIASLFRAAAPIEDQLFYKEMNAVLLSACADCGYWFIPTSVSGAVGISDLPQCIRDIEVDGVITCGDLNPDIYLEMERLGIPFVLLDSIRPSSYPSVNVDYSQSAYTATRHLIQLGHTDIAFLSNYSSHDFNARTLDGFQRAMEEANLAVLPNRIQINIGDMDSIRYCLDHAFSGETRPTAIFSTVDFYSFKIIQLLHSKGYRIPEDISIVSIDDVVVAGLISPPLTTVHIQRERMVKEGIGMLTKLLNGQTCQSVVLPPQELVIRSSTAAPPALTD